MNNYLLSVDPSMKNTGFTLWEYIYQHCKCFGNCSCNNIDIWKPIWIGSCSFKKNSIDNFYRDMHYVIYGTLELKNELTNSKNNFDLIIERGTFHSKNGIGYETQEHLRGFIAGKFNKLLTKDMLISPSEWKKWYVKKSFSQFEKNFIWIKNTSIHLANELIIKQGWNITISNHDEAESLLIGWYYLNKENK
ncbi:hypothetical protein [Spiroplasma endosymbiont of Virgichneumon dumeticola]|uniref:hypothetical protein n=1 Tax=Spiroplasma endosymbiont of Virgichneumon dumeticola TaxID=3139323 RepID=UPI0035C91673